METVLSITPSHEEYSALAERRDGPLIVPFCREIPTPLASPPRLYAGLCKGQGFLLESMEGSERTARYSVIGIDPVLSLSFGEEDTICGDERYVSVVRSPEGATPLEKMRSILKRFSPLPIPVPRYACSFVGYFAYDLVHDLYPQVERSRAGDPRPPAVRSMLARDCVVFDHQAGKVSIVSAALLTDGSDPADVYRESMARIEQIAAKLAAPDDPPSLPIVPEPGVGTVFSSSMTPDEYGAAVLRVKEEIAAGEIFQGVVSRRIECAYPGDPFAIYTALRAMNPGPYMYYLDFGDVRIAGASPEMLVRVEKGTVTTVPIAGTRPRGGTPEEDERLGRELLADEKERAEHTMLVDLARNDLGRVCRYGSVRLAGFMDVEKYSHVQHLVSVVEGALDDRCDCFDAFSSCFPAGTVSGAPKIRAMQIIEAVEPTSRGIYAGAVGSVGFDRSLECAIAIRTVVVEGGVASVQAGAGIVADSVPENEWEETENKALAMLRAIEIGRRSP
ncbi:MAG: anthranilate synthase component [Methanofollis sp.]|nr:anthranilate synthase component [Methanofollis sp.]